MKRQRLGARCDAVRGVSEALRLGGCRVLILMREYTLVGSFVGAKWLLLQRNIVAGKRGLCNEICNSSVASIEPHRAARNSRHSPQEPL